MTEENLTKVKKEPLTAKKDFLIVQNDERYDIKKGDDIIELKVPKKFHPNLKIENVI